MAMRRIRRRLRRPFSAENFFEDQNVAVSDFQRAGLGFVLVAADAAVVLLAIRGASVPPGVGLL